MFIEGMSCFYLKGKEKYQSGYYFIPVPNLLGDSSTMKEGKLWGETLRMALPTFGNKGSLLY